MQRQRLAQDCLQVIEIKQFTTLSQDNSLHLVSYFADGSDEQPLPNPPPEDTAIKFDNTIQFLMVLRKRLVMRALRWCGERADPGEPSANLSFQQQSDTESNRVAGGIPPTKRAISQRHEQSGACDSQNGSASQQQAETNPSQSPQNCRDRVLPSTKLRQNHYRECKLFAREPDQRADCLQQKRQLAKILIHKNRQLRATILEKKRLLSSIQARTEQQKLQYEGRVLQLERQGRKLQQLKNKIKLNMINYYQNFEKKSKLEALRRSVKEFEIQEMVHDEIRTLKEAGLKAKCFARLKKLRDFCQRNSNALRIFSKYESRLNLSRLLAKFISLSRIQNFVERRQAGRRHSSFRTLARQYSFQRHTAERVLKPCLAKLKQLVATNKLKRTEVVKNW